jgi:hypothetical protein
MGAMFRSRRRTATVHPIASEVGDGRFAPGHLIPSAAATIGEDAVTAGAAARPAIRAVPGRIAANESPA